MNGHILKKTLALVVLVGVFALGSVATTEAAFVAWVCNDATCSGGDDLFLNDNDPGDAQLSNGVISWTLPGSFEGYEVVLNFSQSKPAISGGMDLAYAVTNSGGGVLGDIYLFAVDTDFGNGPTVANGSLGGTQPGPTTTTAYICDGDANVGDFSPCSTASSSTTGAFTISGLTHNVTADPYALTIGVGINTLPNGSSATGNFEVTVPEPASMALFGLGLASLAALRRRQIAK